MCGKQEEAHASKTVTGSARLPRGLFGLEANRRLEAPRDVSALVGTAIGYSLAQGQDDCRDCDRYESGSRYEIGGCYRIEMLPDGRERRVELPLSDCR